MKKFFAIASLAVILLGAGCSNSTSDYSKYQGTPTSSDVPTTDVVSNPPVQPVTVTPSTTVNTPEATTTFVNPDIKHAPIVSTTPTVPTTSPKTLTMSDVQAANTPAKCWTAINGKVYDVTAWEKKHPGGEPAILKLCGIDGSSLFNKQHGGQPQPEKALAGFQIGVLK